MPVEVYAYGNTLVARGATWDFNPTLTRADFAEAYSIDPQRAERDYAARPPKSVQAALSDSSTVEKFFTQRESPVDQEGGFKEWFRGQPGTEYYLHIDMSKAHDPTGMGMCHYDLASGKVIVDLIHTIDPTEQWELSFGRIEQLIMTLKESLDFNLVSVSFDSWQSYQMIERLVNKGVKAHLYSVDRGTEAYDTLIEVLLTRRLDYYWQSRFIKEMKELKLYKGTKYDHIPGGSKDTADGVAGCVAQCVKARVGLSILGPEVDSAIHDEHPIELEEMELADLGATYWKLASSDVLLPIERNRVRIARIDVDGADLLFVLGWNDAQRGRLKVEEFLVWRNFTNAGTAMYFEQFLMELMGIMRIDAFSLNELIPLEVVNFLNSTGRRVSSPLSSRVQGTRANTVARTIQITPQAIRMCLQQLKKGNISIPNEVNLIKDLKYTTEDNQMSRAYLKALAGWTDFISREIGFGRSGHTMPRAITGVAAPVNPLNNSRSQAVPPTRPGSEIDRIRAQYNQAYRDSVPQHPQRIQNSVRSLPRPIRGR